MLRENVKRFYIVEDLLTSYEQNNQHNIRKIWPGQKYNDKEDDLKNYRHEIEDWFKAEIQALDGKKTMWNSIHFHNWIMIFEKNF